MKHEAIVHILSRFDAIFSGIGRAKCIRKWVLAIQTKNRLSELKDVLDRNCLGLIPDGDGWFLPLANKLDEFQFGAIPEGTVNSPVAKHWDLDGSLTSRCVIQVGCPVAHRRERTSGLKILRIGTIPEHAFSEIIRRRDRCSF